MRWTDFCHSNENVHPHLARSRFTPQLSLRGRPTETKAPYDFRGFEGFTTFEIASADRSCLLTPSSNPSRAGDTGVGVIFLRQTSDRASDTPVAIYVQPQRLAELPRRCLLLCLGHTSAFLRFGVDRGMRKPPRPSPSPARESLRRVLIRDAFCH